jgi:ribose transport system substrate-binding protein
MLDMSRTTLAGVPALLLFATLGSATLAAEGETVGPNGEAPTPAGEVVLSSEQERAIQEGRHTAALVWHEMSAYTAAVDRGARDEFERLGVEVVAQTDARFDAARQQADVETVLALAPSAIISLPVDPASAATTFGPAREAGVELVFVDNAPMGFVHGADYVSVVSDDLFAMGAQAGRAMAAALGEEGRVGMIFHDADFYVTNQRDGAFKATIEQDYPNMEIAAEAGMADPAQAEAIAQAMILQNPDLDGLYVTWAEPAMGALSALRAAGNTTTRIVTLDLSEPVALDMVEGGNVAAVVADEAYDIGGTAARAAALGLLDQEVPPFLVVGALAVTRENVVEGWERSLRSAPPQSVLDALSE